MIANNVSLTFRVNRTRQDRDDHDEVREEDGHETTSLVDLAEVEVRGRRHQVPDLGAVVIAEVQLLQVREQLRAQHVLGAVRDVERGVPADSRTGDANTPSTRITPHHFRIVVLS